MSGATNQGAYGQPGTGQGPWGAGRRSPGGGDGPRGPAWAEDYFEMWKFSRPLLIAATITGFLVWWPVGLVLLFISIWNRRVGRFLFGRERAGFGCCGWGAGWHGVGMRGMRSSGNQAFDEYKAETLRRLEEEQGEFTQFLDRLRFAKDKAEFDQFMAERRPRPQQPQPEPPHEG